ncbi:MAG: ABC transporter substrate-binding protein, partial [Caldimonas sp.]
MSTPNLSRRTAVAATLAGLSGLAFAQAGSPPIRIGSTLALTGPLSATAQIHKLVGEIYIEQANKRGGWLGRPLEWIVKDDQS